MIRLIFLIILVGSFSGMVFIFLKKLPLLVELPQTSISKGSLALKVKQGIKKLPGSNKLNYELYLQKLLSKVRVLTMKAEGTTESWLAKLRQKAIKKNGHNNDAYWEELKKTKSGK